MDFILMTSFILCYADEPLAVPLDGLHFDDKLQFVEEPVEIVDREVKRLKRSRIPLIKVRWNSKRGPEFTWEREDQFKKKYPHLFTKIAPSSSAASKFVHFKSNCVCSKDLEDKILVPIPDSSQRPLKIENFCLDCGDPIHGLHCQGCALIRKTFEEVLQDFQDTSESSDDNTNVVNAPREPFVVKHNPGENSSPSLPQIDHCCHECGDSLDEIFCRQCTCKSCGKGAHYGYTKKGRRKANCGRANRLKESLLGRFPLLTIDDEDNTIAITPVLPIEEPDNSLIGRIDDDILLTIKDDILREKLLNVNLLIAKIDALRDNPTPSSEVVIKSTSTFPNLFLEETNTFDNSIPESETFRFNLEEISSGSPTTQSELSLPDYKAFYVDNDHFKERSSGSTTTHADFSKYDSFIFDLSINPFPPADRSDFYHEEFADELAHIISPPEYDHFCFKIEPELGNLTMDVVNDIFPTREPRVHVPNVLPTHLTLDTDFILLSEPLFAYIVWIFLPFLTYPVCSTYLSLRGNEDTIFDTASQFNILLMPDVSHRIELS
ncbi:hypothetical protein Tco_1437028 [Tanacetum coccineum]